MQVILQQDVRNLGKVGEVVRVAAGYARNFLFPRRLALPATEEKAKEFAHLKAVAEKKKAKALEARKEFLKKLSGTTVTFKTAAGETDKLFGSITNADISNELDKQGFSVDRRDIVLPEPIKLLGQHKAIVKLGDKLEAEIKINVERA